ncbi:MAG: hypothetical protein ACP5G1_03765 [Nanopusillaceae archaeon]
MVMHDIRSNKGYFSFGESEKIEYITILENKFLPKEVLALPRLKRWMTPFEEDVKVKVNGEPVGSIFELILMLYLTSNYELAISYPYQTKHTMKINNDLYEFGDYNKIDYIKKLENECLPEEVIGKSRIEKWTTPFKEDKNVVINGCKVNTILDTIIMLYTGTVYAASSKYAFIECGGYLNHIILMGDELKKFQDEQKTYYIVKLETKCLRNDSNLPKLIRPFSKKVKINGQDVENILEAILMLYLSTRYREGEKPYGKCKNFY